MLWKLICGIITSYINKWFGYFFPIFVEEGTDIDWEDEANIVTNLTCVAIAGIEDPVRDEVNNFCFDLSLNI
jgi:hypothetical protein